MDREHRAAHDWPALRDEIVGEIIGGRHRIVRRVGTGGVADVVFARGS